MRFRILIVGVTGFFISLSLVAQIPFYKAARDLQPNQIFDNVHVQRLFGDAEATGFVIWVKQSVPLHKHATHSETVCILAGKAEMRLGDQQMTVRKGDLIFIPQGTSHSVLVKRGTLKVLSIQAPAFDGSDRILID
jgi:quercetin dioxygenase-like cupin family protein